MTHSVVLLAGGKSSRMGRDKARLEIDGRPLYQRQLEVLGALSPAQLMLAGPAQAGCDAEIIADEMENAGPLGGVAAALRHSSASHLIVLAVDLPKMTTGFLRSLLAGCGENTGVVPCSSRGLEPLAAIYPASCLSAALASLAQGDYSMQQFARRGLEKAKLRERAVASHELELFTNLNTPADYAQARDHEISRSR